MLDSLNNSYNDFESFLLNPQLDSSIIFPENPNKSQELVSTQNHTNNSECKSDTSEIYHYYKPIGIKNPKYKAINDQGKTYLYETDPILYKKIKKKIQNRLS